MKTHRRRFFAAILIAILAFLGSLSALAQRPRSDRGFSPDDQVINDDLIVTGSGCFGAGCVNNEPFESEMLRLKVAAAPRFQLVGTGIGSVPAQTWEIGGNQGYFYVYDVTSGNVPFYVRHNAPTNSLTVDPNGNIGLGTFFPAGKLHTLGTGNQLSIFQSSNNGAVQFRLQTNSTNRRFVALNSAGQQQSQLLFGDNGAFDFLGPTAADVRMRFLANGNVGIGTTAPTQKLSVNGSAGKPGGGSWSTFSDERLKDIKGEFTSGLDELLQLQPIRYEYKADNAAGITSEGEHIGFGAAAVSKVIPEAVTRDEAGYLMIDNDPILWTMLNAIKEQNAHSTAQNQEIAQLKAQNRQMMEKLERLQAQVVLQAANRELQEKPAVAKANP